MDDPTVIATVATNPTLYGAATNSTVNAGVSANCATGGIAVRAHTPDQKTQHETCASNYDDYQGKCYVVIGKMGAGATPTAAEVVACCTAANVMALNACPCVNVEDGYGVDRSIASTTDIRLDFILNTPGSGCVAALGASVLLRIRTPATRRRRRRRRRHRATRSIRYRARRDTRWTNPKRNPS